MNQENSERRRRMHKRMVECDGYLRDDGLWEVEAWLIDTKPFAQQDRYRGEMKPGEPFTTSPCASRSMTA